MKHGETKYKHVQNINSKGHRISVYNEGDFLLKPIQIFEMNMILLVVAAIFLIHSATNTLSFLRNTFIVAVR